MDKLVALLWVPVAREAVLPRVVVLRLHLVTEFPMMKIRGPTGVCRQPSIFPRGWLRKWDISYANMRKRNACFHNKDDLGMRTEQIRVVQRLV